MDRTHCCQRPARRDFAPYLIPRLPHPRSCFFKQAQFERLLSHDRLEFLRLTPQVLDLATDRGPCRVTRQTPLAGLQKLLRPSVIKALGNAFTAAKLGDAGLGPRRPSRTIRIFSSDEWRLRVARRMFFTIRSDEDLACTDFCLISTP